MEEIIKTLLLEGIDEDTIHRVLDVIEEEYEVVNEVSNKYVSNPYNNLELEKAKRILRKGLAKEKGDEEAFNTAEKEYIDLKERGLKFKEHKQKWLESKNKRTKND